MRMSDTSTCGVSNSSAAMASRALAKLVAGFPGQCFFQHPADRFVVVYYPDWLHYLCAFLWQQDTEIRKSRPALAFDHAHVLLHEGLRQVSPRPLPPSRPDTSG
jgi:hypothetical protein